jgi:hypothetical protein
MTRAARAARTGVALALTSFPMTVSSWFIVLLMSDGLIARAYFALANWPSIFLTIDFDSRDESIFFNMLGWGLVGLILGAIWPRPD